MIEKDNIVVETFPLGSFACNCSLVYNKQTKECIAIDPGNDYSSFMELVRSRELKLKKLIHTHAHFDHIGRSKEIKDATGADIYLHQSDEQLYNSLKQQAMFFGEDVGETGVVDHFLNDEEELYLDNQSSKNMLKTFHTPGHTPGSCCFYTEELGAPLLFSGDTLFKGSIGRTDFPGGNYDEIMKSIKQRLLFLPEETNIITGHGPSTSIYNEKKENPFLN
ncbi:MAG: MBL fold metallo-hydrolase [Bdellovibrionales bacterium]|jgi:hydroxyacylglutathione hydrolase|nr:MBL fold metallo-hydrolase [Bdellovibrionales bacterium]